MAWSSDGTRLLILRGGDGEEQLVVLHADGSETQVTDRAMQIRSASISPDGSRIVFAAFGRDPAGSDSDCCVYVVEADGGPVEMLPVPAGLFVEEVTFSPDGTRIAYVEGGGDHGHSVWLMDADGSDAHRILSNETTTGPSHVYGLAWSPAGDRIALGLEGRIYTFSTDGSGFTRVVASGERPYWSPDGSQLAYTIECCGLAIENADGSERLTFDFGAAGPWHPGGSPQSPDDSALQPATSEPVLQFNSWAADGSVVVVLEDGRVIWSGDEQDRYLELQLTPEGVELVRSRVMSSGLFERDLALRLDRDSASMEVFRDDQSVMVTWGRVPLTVPDVSLQARLAEASSAQAVELAELEAFFRDPAAWALPPEMYGQPGITPFVPTHLWISYDRSRPDFSTLPPPAREVVMRLLEPPLSRGIGCEISIAHAREVVDALVEAGVTVAIDDIRTGFGFDVGPPLRPSFVHLHAALPPAADCP